MDNVWIRCELLWITCAKPLIVFNIVLIYINIANCQISYMNKLKFIHIAYYYVRTNVVKTGVCARLQNFCKVFLTKKIALRKIFCIMLLTNSLFCGIIYTH